MNRFVDFVHEKFHFRIMLTSTGRIPLSTNLSTKYNHECYYSWLRYHRMCPFLTFFELFQKPHIVDKIVADVQSVCDCVRKKENDSFLDADHSIEKHSKLKYTDAVVMKICSSE